MKTLARWISNRSAAWGVVLVVALLSLASLYRVGGLGHDDDVLAFLPRDNPDVGAFYYVNERFGSLDLALVGIEAEDVFAPDFLRRLQRATKDLKNTRGMDHVLSLANVVDFTPDLERGGIVTSTLVETIPKSAVEREALRRKVMSRDHLVGHLVSEDGRAVLIYCFLAYGSDQRALAGSIRNVLDQAFPSHHKYWGGGPFISTYIYDTTQSDIRRLTPWAVLAIVLIMMAAFRDIIGVCLVLFSTALGILLSLGVMASFDVRFNIVLGSMPVILFAIGSAYGIHMLSRYYAYSEKKDCLSALMHTMCAVGPTVLTAGLTTSAGLLSFIAMDIQPLRTFGLFTSLGILATLALSVTFIPAVVVLTRLKHKPSPSIILGEFTARLSVFARQHRLVVGLVLLVVGLGAGTLISRVRARMENASFYSEDSPPDKSDKFMRNHFGGSHFIQVHAKADFGDPHVLREWQRLADRISLLPRVSNVLHVSDILAKSTEAMVGQRRVPDTPEQVGLQYTFLVGDPSLAQVVTPDYQQALMHIKVDASQAEEIEDLLEEVERIVATEAVTCFTVGGEGTDGVRERIRDLITLRIRSLAHVYGVPLGSGRLQRLGRHLVKPSPAADAAGVKMELLRFLGSDECAVDCTRLGVPLENLAEPLVGLGPGAGEESLTRTLAGSLQRPEDDALVGDLAFSVAAPLAEIWNKQCAVRRAGWLIEDVGLEVPESAKGQRFVAALCTTLLDLKNPTAMLPAGPDAATGSLELRVTGLPVMHRGLSISATSNQIKSLIFALVLVVLIMSVYLRSVFSGLLVATPTLLTLLVIYGGMGLLGVRLDIGTAMLASLILGAGVDYAVHLVSAWHVRAGEPLREAAAWAANFAGPAIWTNAIMVCVGFFVLTLGEARPLKNVGGLTATAMIVAALATFICIPVLARKRFYRQQALVAEESGVERRAGESAPANDYKR
jgi:predicted RND superfamily exporter protein